jgi:hypothetical protein
MKQQAAANPAHGFSPLQNILDGQKVLSTTGKPALRIGNFHSLTERLPGLPVNDEHMLLNRGT